MKPWSKILTFSLAGAALFFLLFNLVEIVGPLLTLLPVLALAAAGLALRTWIAQRDAPLGLAAGHLLVLQLTLLLGVLLPEMIFFRQSPDSVALLRFQRLVPPFLGVPMGMLSIHLLLRLVVGRENRVTRLWLGWFFPSLLLVVGVQVWRHLLPGYWPLARPADALWLFLLLTPIALIWPGAFLRPAAAPERKNRTYFLLQAVLAACAVLVYHGLSAPRIALVLLIVFSPLPLLWWRRSDPAAGSDGPVIGRPEEREEWLRRCGITAREREILDLLGQGCSNREIEDRLFISLPTVKRHLANIFRKTGCRSRLQLVTRYGGSAKPSSFPE
jgi:DNA-binding CsgD family transcriptional regulator